MAGSTRIDPIELIIDKNSLLSAKKDKLKIDNKSFGGLTQRGNLAKERLVSKCEIMCQSSICADWVILFQAC